MDGNRPLISRRICCAGFVAGFLATLVFHQLTVALLWATGLSPFAPYSTALTEPLGIPAVLSLAFWGGIWGVIYVAVAKHFPRASGYWIASFLFGAVAPSLVALLVVLPLKGRPVGGGWNPSLLITAFLANGAWGAGTGIFLKLILNRFKSP
jgi:hypothetical protein